MRLSGGLLPNPFEEREEERRLLDGVHSDVGAARMGGNTLDVDAQREAALMRDVRSTPSRLPDEGDLCLHAVLYLVQNPRAPLLFPADCDEEHTPLRTLRHPLLPEALQRGHH